MSGGAGHGSVSRPEICRATGAALPRSRPAVARSLAGLLLGLRRVHAGVSARRQGDGDQHGGQGRAAHATVSGESAQSEVVAQHGVRLQRGVGPSRRHGGTAGERGDGVQAGADADGEDARHRPSRTLPDLPLQQVPRVVLQDPSASRAEHVATGRTRHGPKSPTSTAARRNTTRWKSGKRSSRCWSTTASRFCCRSRTAAACRCSPTATSPKPGATPRQISASWHRTPDRASPSWSAGQAAAWS